MLSRLSWDVGSRRALTPPRANRETGVSAPGGERRVRTNVYDPDFGYTKEGAAALVEGRVLQADWLVDVRVHLVDVRPARPPAWERLWERFRSS